MVCSISAAIIDRSAPKILALAVWETNLVHTAWHDSSAFAPTDNCVVGNSCPRHGHGGWFQLIGKGECFASYGRCSAPHSSQKPNWSGAKKCSNGRWRQAAWDARLRWNKNNVVYLAEDVRPRSVKFVCKIRLKVDFVQYLCDLFPVDRNIAVV